MTSRRGKRPVKQPRAPKGIDCRTNTRFATDEEVELARIARAMLEEERNQIDLVPAPDPHFVGHKIRVVASRNPKWYVEFGSRFWRGERQFDLKRSRVEKALDRVAIKRRVRGNGYEKELLEWLKEHLPSRAVTSA